MKLEESDFLCFNKRHEVLFFLIYNNCVKNNRIAFYKKVKYTNKQSQDDKIQTLIKNYRQTRKYIFAKKIFNFSHKNNRDPKILQ